MVPLPSPIIDLDGENKTDVLLLAKSLGYFYIPRLSSYGQIPEKNSLKCLLDGLFSLSLEEKLSLGSDYVRSVYLNEPPSKKESVSWKSTSQMINIPQSGSIKILFNICQQLSIHLIDLLELKNNSPSSSCDTILFNHYYQPNEPIIINNNDDSFLQFHLFSTCDLQRLDSLEHEWKLIPYSADFDNYILVILPNFLYRYSMNDSSSHYTINYLSSSDMNIENGSYFLSLKQNTALRYFTFFYLYVMQGIPAGFSSTALANYLTGKIKCRRNY